MKPQQSYPSPATASVRAFRGQHPSPLLPTLGVTAVALASCLVLLLAGCASSAGIESRAAMIDPVSIGLQHPPAQAEPGTAISAAWWRGFDDSVLNDLVERSLGTHPSLRLAQARLARAQAGVSGAQAAEGLAVNASVDVTRQRFSATSIYPRPLGGSIQTLGTAQIGASWEFDFFGRHRSAIEAAVGTQQAAEADMQAARILLGSNVARVYVQLGRTLAQREVAERALKQREETLALIQQRVQSGLDTSVELRQGEGALPDARQQIEQLDEQASLQRHALAALTAQPLAALDGLAPALANLPAMPLPASLPADLLGRRADIAAARWRIEAAAGDFKNAQAQFYPNINLSAFVGLSSIGLDRLVKADSRQYGGGPALHLPIFDAGRLRAQLRTKGADLDAAVESYNTAVIDAVHEAADQVGSLQSIERQQREQAQAQGAAEAAYDLATQRYRAGLGTYLVVLNAEASVLAQRRLGIDLKARALDAQIALVRSLGGGYAAPAGADAVAAVH
jgi:NodT family efflux transporter outer membrane factor (OMF) lipoprotein